jgi:hypothetical protein
MVLEPVECGVCLAGEPLWKAFHNGSDTMKRPLSLETC